MGNVVDLSEGTIEIELTITMRKRNYFYFMEGVLHFESLTIYTISSLSELTFWKLLAYLHVGCAYTDFSTQHSLIKYSASILCARIKLLKFL
jgi:hypothetical protein